MNFKYLAAVAALAFCCGAKAAPLDAYGHLPSISDVAVSPDGDKIAYFTHDAAGNQGVVAAALNPAKQLLGGGYGHSKLRSLLWADDNHLLVVRSVTKKLDDVIAPRTEWYQLDSIDLKTGKATELLRDVKEGMNIVQGDVTRRTVNGRPVVFVQGLAWVESVGRNALYSVDVATSESKLVPHATVGKDDWIIDGNGEVIAETSYSETGHHWNLWIIHGNSQRLAYTVETTIDMPSVEGLSPDGSSLILSMLEDGRNVHRTISLKDGTAGPPIKDYDEFDGFLHDPLTRRAIAGYSTGTTTTYKFFNPKDQAAWDAILRTFPDEEVDLASWSDDRSRVVVSVTGQAHGVAYVLVDTRTHQALKVGDAYAGIQPDDLAGVESIEYKAADGLKIPAFLTLPNGKPAKNLPLIVLPHGGPAAMDEPGFDWWAQALASRGYAVLQPQFRGSDGFGAQFMAAGYGQWGRKMQTDLSDGVRALAHAGMIDPKRVCIVGASYGGYAALAGAAIDPGAYRCAVSVAGLSDVRKFLAWHQDNAGSAYTPSMRFWDRFMGSKNPQDPSLDAISPIKHLDKVTIPVLLIHGKDDTVVPFQQSQLMADAMKAAGKPVEFVVLQSEDHWLSRSETRLQMLDATVKFLETNNPPG